MLTAIKEGIAFYKSMCPLVLCITETPLINLPLPSGPVHPYQLDESISKFRVSDVLFLFLFYFE